MSDDEQATIAALDKARDVFREVASAGSGRVVDTAGDSVLVIFETAVSAVAAALEIQRHLEEISRAGEPSRNLSFRIGVHLGDVFEKKDGSIYGEGVNIAARLQALALPGGVVVSDAIRTSVRRRLPAEFLDLGNKTVKNIVEPVHAFRMIAASAEHLQHGSPFNPSGAAWPIGWLRTAWSGISSGVRAWLVVAVIVLGVGAFGAVSWIRIRAPDAPDRSIAVLPFVDMSEKHDQEYFSDGLSEELIDHLANAAGLKVIARTSSFQFKGKNEDVRLIAQKLGVANVLEGSVRRSGEQVRITAQLIRAEDGTHIWLTLPPKNVLHS